MTDDSYISAVRRNNKRLFLIALSFTKNHFDAEEILQNTFLKLWCCEKPFADDDHIDKWLTTVCVNESRNYLRSPFRFHSSLDTVSDMYSFDVVADQDVFNAVMSLPKKERVVIHLFYYEDMSVRDIAALLRLTESAVKTRLHRARNNLKNMLGDDWINE